VLSGAKFDGTELSKNLARGVTAVSAVALWLKAGEYARAEQLARSLIADSQIPDFARKELRNLVGVCLAVAN
jgi:hypothetical protein